MAGFRRRRFSRRRKFGGRRKVRRFVRKIRRISKSTIRRMAEVKRTIIGTTTTVTNTYQLLEITPGSISQGANAVNNRIGNRIRLKRITFNYFAAASSTSDTTPQATVFRFVLLQPREIITQPADVLDDGVSTTPALGNIFYPLRPSACRVLIDRHWTLSGADPTNGNSASLNVPSFRKSGKISMPFVRNVLYQSSTSTTIEQPKNKLYVLVGATNNTASVAFFVNGRMSYIDI